MKVQWSADFTEDSLRRIRKYLGGSGAATRKEVRVWITGVVLGRIGTLEPAKPKRRTADRSQLQEGVDFVRRKAKGWRCPACKQWTDEPMGRACAACRSRDDRTGAILHDAVRAVFPEEAKDDEPDDEPRPRRLTRTERQQALADRGCDTWEEYRGER
jgi:hypothetical protein